MKSDLKKDNSNNNQSHEMKTHTRLCLADFNLIKNNHCLIRNQETINTYNENSNNIQLSIKDNVIQSKQHKCILKPLYKPITTISLDETNNKQLEPIIKTELFDAKFNHSTNPSIINKQQSSLSQNVSNDRLSNASLQLQKLHKSQLYDKFNSNMMKSLYASLSKNNSKIKDKGTNNDLFKMIINVNNKLKQILLKSQDGCNLPKIPKGAKHIIVNNVKNKSGNSNYFGDKYDPYNYLPINSKNRTKRNSYGYLYVY